MGGQGWPWGVHIHTGHSTEAAPGGQDWPWGVQIHTGHSTEAAPGPHPAMSQLAAQERAHLHWAYLLGLLAMIKCSICSYQCDN